MKKFLKPTFLKIIVGCLFVLLFIIMVSSIDSPYPSRTVILQKNGEFCKDYESCNTPENGSYSQVSNSWQIMIPFLVGWTTGYLFEKKREKARKKNK